MTWLCYNLQPDWPLLFLVNMQVTYPLNRLHNFLSVYEKYYHRNKGELEIIKSEA